MHPYTYYFIRGQDQFARNFDRGVASRGLAKLAIALRVRRMAQGSYPASLADLVPSFLDTLPTDPFSGKSCIFRREKGGPYEARYASVKELVAEVFPKPEPDTPPAG